MLLKLILLQCLVSRLAVPYLICMDGKTSIVVIIMLQDENKVKLSEMSSQLMMKENELTKVKEDNKLLVKQFRDRKEKKRRETIPQVCYY